MGMSVITLQSLQKVTESLYKLPLKELKFIFKRESKKQGKLGTV